MNTILIKKAIENFLESMKIKRPFLSLFIEIMKYILIILIIILSVFFIYNKYASITPLLQELQNVNLNNPMDESVYAKVSPYIDDASTLITLVITTLIVTLLVIVFVWTYFDKMLLQVQKNDFKFWPNGTFSTYLMNLFFTTFLVFIPYKLMMGFFDLKKLAWIVVILFNVYFFMMKIFNIAYQEKKFADNLKKFRYKIFLAVIIPIIISYITLWLILTLTAELSLIAKILSILIFVFIMLWEIWIVNYFQISYTAACD